MSVRVAIRTVWHPHQKLSNWQLTRFLQRHVRPRPLARFVESLLILTDSVLLLGRTRRRRSRRDVGSAPAAATQNGTGRPSVLYIDCGVHKHAEQVQWMQRWFGQRYDLHVLAFEAGGEHARDAAQALNGMEHLRLHQIALVGPLHDGDVARLYKDSSSGKADSLLRDGGERFEDVPARRLSAVLADEGWDLSRTPTILRMNIEGAEQFVIEDLVEAGLAGCIDGYYGMWDDLSKIDPDADERFQRLLAEQGISTVTFNDRDLAGAGEGGLGFSPRALPTALRRLAFRLRRGAIRRDIESAYAAGVARVAGGGSAPPPPPGA
jgi:hypothetical protein